MKKTWRQAIGVFGLVVLLGACSTSKKSGDSNDTDLSAASTTDAGTDVVPPAGNSNSVSQASDSGAAVDGSQTYTVQKYDTLMKIAFNVFGSVYGWKKIYEGNKDKISDPNNIKVGMVLNVGGGAGPSQPTGERYLIKKGDTLGKISGELYGTRARWKELWENNKQMIRNPNKIFSGFYLYYVGGNAPAPVQTTPVGDEPKAGGQEAPAQPQANVPAEPEQPAVTQPAAPEQAVVAPPAESEQPAVTQPAAADAGSDGSGDVPPPEN